MSLPMLRTSRLLLQPFDRDDVDALHALWTDADVRRHLWDDEVIPRNRAAVTIDGAIESAGSTGVGMWTIREAATPQHVVGFSGLRHLPSETDVELLYGLHPLFWGRGFATEAADAVLRYAYSTLRLPRVLAGADAANTRSVGVMQRLGMMPLAGGVPAVPGATYYALDAAAYFARLRA